MNVFSSTIRAAKDFLFTTTCFHCGMALQDGEQRICGQCWSSLTRVGENDYTFKVLQDRFSEGKAVDELVTLYYFEKGKLLQSLAHSLKYEEVTSFGFELGKKLSGKLSGKKIDVIIPVPLNKRKERERGYNQSDFIAEGVSSVLGIPVLPDVVHRIKYTVTQTQLNAEQRKENIAEAFAVRKAELIRGKNVLLVDDIITTGSTIQEAAKVLKEAGALTVISGSIGLAKLGEDN